MMQCFSAVPNVFAKLHTRLVTYIHIIKKIFVLISNTFRIFSNSFI